MDSKKVLENSIKDKKVIIVGSSSNLEGKGKGAYIDNFDYVVKFNGSLFMGQDKNFFRDKNRISGPSIGWYRMSYWTSIEIDTIEDFKILESIMKEKVYGN